VTIWRKGASRDVTLTVAEVEPDKVAKAEEKKTKPEQVANMLGLSVSDLTEAQRKELKIDFGVLVDAAEGNAARVGIRPGDTIQRLNNTDIKDAKQFNALVAKLDSKKMAVLLVRRGDSSLFVPLRPTPP
jgi:serine protease Do